MLGRIASVCTKLAALLNVGTVRNNFMSEKYIS